jgi:hypothetical protein
MPLIPSTPLPEQVVFGGTPAWDPSSQTPRKLSDPPIPSHLLIPKPHGQVTRIKGGYKLEDVLHLDDGLLLKIKV